MIFKKKSYLIILKCKKATNYGSQIVKKKQKKHLQKTYITFSERKLLLSISLINKEVLPLYP